MNIQKLHSGSPNHCLSKKNKILKVLGSLRQYRKISSIKIAITIQKEKLSWSMAGRRIRYLNRESKLFRFTKLMLGCSMLEKQQMACYGWNIALGEDE